MTTIKFVSGLREIGGTFIEVETEKAKCMFDFGFGNVDRIDNKVNTRNDIAADYVELGILAKVDGIYNEETGKKLGIVPYNKMDKKCFFLISHMHIDHMGGLGLLDDDIPVYMSSNSLRLYENLAKTGEIEFRKHKNSIGVDEYESFTIEDITVKVLPIDHDVIGASGFLITTKDGSVCYTGDYRMHGFHNEVTEKFASIVKGTDVLITEGVTVSFEDIDMLSLEEPEDMGRTESSLLEEIKEYGKNDGGLIIINPYNRNVERIHKLLNGLKEVGRILVVDEVQATYVKEFYPSDEIYVYENTSTNLNEFKTISKDEILKNPQKYVLQLDYKNIYELIDLKNIITRYVHMDGSPLGDYDPSFKKMHSVLEQLKIPYEYKGTGGHAKPYYLREFIDKIEPKTLVPLHSFRPEQVNSKKAGSIFLPKPLDVFKLGE